MIALANQIAELFAGTMNLGFDRPKRKFQPLGKLLVGVLLQKAHADQARIARRESLEVQSLPVQVVKLYFLSLILHFLVITAVNLP